MITPDKTFEITALSEADLQYLGYDTYKLDDDDMEELAAELADDYCDQLYWTSLDIIADYKKIPKIEYVEAIIEWKDESPEICEIEEVIIRINKDITSEDEDDDNIFFYCRDMQDLRDLMNRNNKEDFIVLSWQPIDYE